MRELGLFFSGWVALGAIGTTLTLCSLPTAALIVVSAMGLLASVTGFNGCEMLLAMVLAVVLGSLLLPKIEWAWIAPWLPGGFMSSVALEELVKRTPPAS